TELTLYYSFDGSDCSDASVDEIIVDLGLPNGDLETFVTDCFSSPGGLVMTNLAAGTYDVWVAGYGYDGVLFYESTGWRTLEVRRGIDNGYDVAVPATLGDLSLNWTFFEDPSCLDVYEVRVTIEDPFGSIYDDSYYDCGAAGVLYSNVV